MNMTVTMHIIIPITKEGGGGGEWKGEIPYIMYIKYSNTNISFNCASITSRDWCSCWYKADISWCHDGGILPILMVLCPVMWGVSIFFVVNSNKVAPEQLSSGGGENVGHSPAESGTVFWALCTTSATLWPLVAKPLLHARHTYCIWLFMVHDVCFLSLWRESFQWPQTGLLIS